MGLKIAIIGAHGAIGKSLYSDLQRHNYDVTGFYRQSSNSKNNLDLSKPLVFDTVGDSLLSGFDVVVYCSQVTKETTKGSMVLSSGIDMINNLLLQLSPEQHLIFLSTSDIKWLKTFQYTENSNFYLAYAKYKFENVRILKKSKLKKISILRLAPVYSNNLLTDLAKRVKVSKLPRVKLRLVPSPKYKLCHINIVLSQIKTLLTSSCLDRCKVYHLNDKKMIKQNELLNYFEGVNIIFPLIILRCFRSLLSLFLIFEKAKMAYIILTKEIGENNN